MIEAVNLAEKFATFADHWRPRIVGELNGQQVVPTAVGLWPGSWVSSSGIGTLRMQLPDGEAQIRAGEFIIVPCGVAHLPIADDEVLVLLFEPAATRNTGNVESERTVANPERI